MLAQLRSLAGLHHDAWRRDDKGGSLTLSASRRRFVIQSEIAEVTRRVALYTPMQQFAAAESRAIWLRPADHPGFMISAAHCAPIDSALGIKVRLNSGPVQGEFQLFEQELLFDCQSKFFCRPRDQMTAIVALPEGHWQEVNTERGYYYVTIHCASGSKAYALGPHAHHVEALAKVAEVERLARASYGRGCLYLGMAVSAERWDEAAQQAPIGRLNDELLDEQERHNASKFAESFNRETRGHHDVQSADLDCGP